MHRSISVNLVTKIEYAESLTEADMNLYEIYFINLWKPSLNIDDKCKDELTIQLPDVEWKTFTTPLWNKWKEEITAIDQEYQMQKQEQAAKREMDRIMKRKLLSGEIPEEEYYRYISCNCVEDYNDSYIDFDEIFGQLIRNKDLRKLYKWLRLSGLTCIFYRKTERNSE